MGFLGFIHHRHYSKGIVMGAIGLRYVDDPNQNQLLYLHPKSGTSVLKFRVTKLQNKVTKNMKHSKKDFSLCFWNLIVWIFARGGQGGVYNMRSVAIM